jgi:hypothetical protein
MILYYSEKDIEVGDEQNCLQIKDLPPISWVSWMMSVLFKLSDLQFLIWKPVFVIYIIVLFLLWW